MSAREVWYEFEMYLLCSLKFLLLAMVKRAMKEEGYTMPMATNLGQFMTEFLVSLSSSQQGS